MENHLHQEATVAYKWRTTCFHGQNKNESRVWPAMYCFEEHVTAQYEGWIGRRPDLVHSAGTRRSPVQKLCVSRFHLGRFQFEPWSFFSLSSSLRSLFACSNERNYLPVATSETCMPVKARKNSVGGGRTVPTRFSLRGGLTAPDRETPHAHKKGHALQRAQREGFLPTRKFVPARNRTSDLSSGGAIGLG